MDSAAPKTHPAPHPQPKEAPLKRTELTSNQHIEFVRDYSKNKYRLVKGLTEELELGEEHFHPVFFAKNVEELRDNPQAQKTLKQYKIFVSPEEVENAIEQAKKEAKKLNLNIEKPLQEKFFEEERLWMKLYHQQEQERQQYLQQLEAKQQEERSQTLMKERLANVGKPPPSHKPTQSADLQQQLTEHQKVTTPSVKTPIQELKVPEAPL